MTRFVRWSRSTRTDFSSQRGHNEAVTWTRLAADTAYGTGKFLHWVIGTGITPHIPVWDMSKREEGILSRADFAFDRQRDLYICPQGKFLRTTGAVHDDRTIVYRASTRDCVSG